jgi:DNA-binding GntR family transcriptional regulator
MRERPDACAAELARLLGRSQTTVGDRLRRLEDQGVVVRERRGWALADPELGAPAPATAIPWVETLSASHVARHAAGMRVRDELTRATNERDEWAS